MILAAQKVQPGDLSSPHIGAIENIRTGVGLLDDCRPFSVNTRRCAHVNLAGDDVLASWDGDVSDGAAAAQSLESGGSGVSDTDGNDDESSDGVSSQRGAWTAAPDNTARVAVRNRVYVLHSQWYCPLYSLCVHLAWLLWQ